MAETSGLDLRRHLDAVEVWVHVHPRAAREAVGGTHDRALCVRVQVPPTEGRANQALCRALAAALGVRPGAVTLQAGGRARRKRLRIEGDPEALAAHLGVLAREGEHV